MQSTMHINVFVIILSLLFASCKTQENQAISIIKSKDRVIENSSVLKQASKFDTLSATFYNQIWVHRYEEDSGDHQMYRPVKTSILTSLYRNQLIFNKNGTCEYRWLSPVDAHEMRGATWLFDDHRLYILEEVDKIIDVYKIINFTDSLMILTKEPSPINNVFGEWKLITSGQTDLSHLGYFINIKGVKIEIGNTTEILHSYDMQHSARRLQEPLALILESDISRLYPWIMSGHYGIINDTLTIEIEDGIYTKFIR